MTLWQTLFGFAGRIGRSTFWLLIIAVLLLDLAVVAFVSDWIHSEYLQSGIPHRPGGDVIGAGFALLVVGVISAWAAMGVMVKRAHDLERSGWWLLIGLIPVYGLARLIMDLGFLVGSSRRNRFGEGVAFVGNPQPERPAVLALETVEPLQASSFEPNPVHDVTTQTVLPDAAAATGHATSDAPEDHPGSAEPEPEHRPELAHPLMLWGKTYRADLSWPEFHAFSSLLPPEPAANATGPLSAARAQEDPPTAEAQDWEFGMPVKPETPVQDIEQARDEPVRTEPPPASDSEFLAASEQIVAQSREPPPPAPLQWTPAPSHEAYAELASLTPEPADDSPLSQEPR